MTSTFGRVPPPTFTIAGDLDAGTLEQHLSEILKAELPRYLPGRRWFGHKQQRIQSISVVGGAVVAGSDNIYALIVVRLRLENGTSAEYFAPLVVTPTSHDETELIAVIDADGNRWSVVDATSDAGFRRWFLEQFRSTEPLAASGNKFRWQSSEVLSEQFDPGLTGDSAVISGEQSNTSIIYGRRVMLKLFRRIEHGINPDVEIGHFLTERTSFRNMPLLLGEMRFQDAAGHERSLGVAQSFVSNVGDGWQYALNLLAHPAQELMTDATTRESAFVEDAGVLGVRTAQLHLALASGEDHAFAPEPVGAADIHQWTENLLSALDRTNAMLSGIAARSNDATGELARAFHHALPGFRLRAAGFERLLGSAKTRVHGDFHLGQTLRTETGDYVIIDFEGEPQRSIAERRVKTSPLKDVAGMLRSFSYARGAGEQSTHEGPGQDLAAWEHSVRRAFLDAYHAEGLANDAPFLPRTREDFHEALTAWELEKGLYEVAYELNNRPHWLWLPLTALIELG